MTVRSITVTVPEEVYAQLEAQARTTAQSVDDLVTQTLAHALPPAPEGDLPPAVQAELQAMSHLSDDALWAIAGSSANADKVALYDLLIERQSAGSLTPEGQHLLTQLREEADALMVRKAQAYALLHVRGYNLPGIDELRSQPRWPLGTCRVASAAPAERTGQLSGARPKSPDPGTRDGEDPLAIRAARAGSGGSCQRYPPAALPRRHA